MASIMIVEDEAILAMNTRLSLEALGHSVVGVATSGRQALEMLRDGPEADIVFMDIVLQGDLSGIETAEIINNRYSARVVFITAHTDAHTIELANRTRHFGFVFKPFDDYQLTEAIEKAMGEI